MFNTRLCVAYTNAGKGREYFQEHIKKTVDGLQLSGGDDSSQSVPLAGATYVLIRHEDLLSECKLHFNFSEQL